MKIHIIGASGSGTTTLGKALSKKLNYAHYDTDDYFWEDTDPPFQKKRERKLRQDLLEKDLIDYDNWVLSGTLCGWGDKFIPMFDLVIYLWIPRELRIHRLIEREKERYGEKIKEGGDMHQTHLDFVKWASNYDNGGMNMRSKKLHDAWLERISCKVLRIEGEFEIIEKIEKIIKYLDK